MSWSRGEITIWCDHEGSTTEDNCDQWFMVNAVRVTAARRAVRRRGWEHRDGKDYCPDHAKQRTDELPGPTGGLATAASVFEERATETMEGKS